MSREQLGLFPIEALEKIVQHLGLKQIKELMAASPALRSAVEAHPIIWKRHTHKNNVSCSMGYILAVKREHAQTKAWIENSIVKKYNTSIGIPVEATKMKVYGDIIITSFNSPIITVHDMALKKLHILKGHKGSIWAFDYKNNLLLTGSTDKTARIWDCFLGSCMYVLSGHKSTIRCAILTEEYAITASRDSTIRIWCIKTGECKHILTGHRGSIREIKAIEGRPYIVSISYDGTSILWDYKKGQGVRLLLTTHRRLYSVIDTPYGICMGGMDHALYMVSTDGNIQFQSKAGVGIIFRLKKDNEYVYGLATDGRISKWSLKKKESVYSIKVAQKAVDFSLTNHLLIVGVVQGIQIHRKTDGQLLRYIHSNNPIHALCCTEDRLFYSTCSSRDANIYLKHFLAEM